MAKFDERNFGTLLNDSYDIESLIAKDESIIWRGKPNRKAFISAQVFKMLPFALIWLIFDSTFITVMAVSGVFNDLPVIVAIFIGVFMVFHLIPVWIWLSNVLTAGKRHKNIEYAFTDKRIIIKSGLIGIDITNIFYTDIEGVNLKVGITDKIFKVGDIYIKGKTNSQVLWDIDNPYAITTQLQKVVNDIKTDTMYPNNLRPDTNSGYNTKYNGTQF